MHQACAKGLDLDLTADGVAQGDAASISQHRRPTDLQALCAISVDSAEKSAIGVKMLIAGRMSSVETPLGRADPCCRDAGRATANRRHRVGR